jgi:uncharacterized membrane protein
VHISRSVDVDASAATVWKIWTDVERWPEWNETVHAVRRLDDGPLHVGSVVRVKQPRLPAAVWRVTEVDEGRMFVWVTRSVGVTTVGRHRIESRGEGSTTVTASVDFGGALGPLVGRLGTGLTRRYLAMEVGGLKARCEGTA